ncbi:hypothetical protein CEP52_002303 [Fusarium oligoseptatum]|uniref:Heterokaryon incompatibility domain-containing protein n=1 Tax=Fusarium oligoseptatum TaxID=2604345 RepID=A0A428UEN8_9HYPO|nr:hypothetical protein CEP52_002303 [Fusarium oligoseptatum]
MSPITFCAICEEILTWTITGLFRPNGTFRGQLKKYDVPKPQAFDPECPLCSMFECLLEPEFHASRRPNYSFKVSIEPDPEVHNDTVLRLGRDSRYISSDHTISRGSIRIRRDASNDRNRQYNAFQTYLERQLAKESVNSPSASKSTWSLSSLNQVISWLSDCKNSHSDCNAKTKSSLQLPKRLVDVDPDGCISAPPTSEAEFQQLSIENMPKVRVCETDSLTSSPQYLTLSHRWDTNPTILLTGDNLVQFLEEIPVSSLNQRGSKTIRDAIFVTRCLGFRYLWIDAICINQRQTDDQGRETKDELLEEIAIMNQIYANGTCNISATSAKSAADGLFFNPLGSRLLQALKHRREQPATPGRMGITFNGDFVDFIDSCPLNTRGWVFQERMLSPRVIHFTNLQIYWECFVAQLSERHELCLHSKELSQGVIGRKLDLAICPKRPSPTNKPSSANKPSSGRRKQRDPDIPRWYSLAYKYSKLSLSHPEDRLPAISALARAFQVRRKLTPNAYIAGHWRSDLWFTLHWRIVDRRSRQDANYLAPSWSWASVGCRVDGPTMELPLNKFADIFDVSVVNENNDPFGKIKSGSFRLRCHMSQAVIARKGPNLLHVLVGREWLSSDSLDAFLDFQTSDARQPVMGGTVPLPDNDRVQFPGYRVFLALLCRYKGHHCGAAKRRHAGAFRDKWADFNKEPFPGEPTGDYAGLILYPTGKEGQFVRVGTFLLEPRYRRKEDTRPLSSEEDKEIAPEKRGKIRGRDLSWGMDTKERYEFDSDDDEMFYGMAAKDTPIARGLLGRFQNGNQVAKGSLDAEGRQVIEIV